MIKYLTVILLVFATINVHAQASEKGLGTNDPEAKKILDAVSTKFKSFIQGMV